MQLISDFTPTQDQKIAIDKLNEGLNKKYQTFRGITGSGKTYVLANLISQNNKPSILMAPNKVLAFQLYQELIKFFPNDFIGYYVSNYDVYIPTYFNVNQNQKIESTVIVNQKNKQLRYTVKEFLEQSDKAILVCSSTIIFPTFKDDIVDLIKENKEYILRRLKEEKVLQVEKFKENEQFEEASLLENQIEHTIDMILKNPEYFNTNMLALLNEKLGDFYLTDYFKDNPPNLYIDESHLSLIQFKALPQSNKKRLQLLVDKGFYINNVIKDNVLNFEQITKRVGPITFVSATPSSFELEKSSQVIDLLSRPNNLPDPEIISKPRNYFGSQQMIDDVKSIISKNETVFINCISRQRVEDIYGLLARNGIISETIHFKTRNDERKKILEKLRKGILKIVVGINMLREGIDVSYCTLVIIEQADRGNFLRTKSSLIQLSGRAARNINGKVYMCYDKVSKALAGAINEINYRRKIQTGIDFVPLEAFIKPINLVIKKGNTIKLQEGEWLITKYCSDQSITVSNYVETKIIDKSQIISIC